MAPARRSVNKDFSEKRKFLLQLTFGEAWNEIISRTENRKSSDLHSQLLPTKNTVSVGR